MAINLQPYGLAEGVPSAEWETEYLASLLSFQLTSCASVGWTQPEARGSRKSINAEGTRKMSVAKYMEFYMTNFFQGLRKSSWNT